MHYENENEVRRKESFDSSFRAKNLIHKYAKYPIVLLLKYVDIST